MTNDGHFLHSFFYPKSVAVIGASNTQGTMNYNLVANLVNLKFTGKIYPVNPNAQEVMGLKAYPDVRSIEGPVDLAVIAVPATKTPDILKDCVAMGIKRVTLIAGGFSETGAKGRGVQNDMLEMLRANGVRATGPNTLSPVNTRNNLVISFFPVPRLLQGGLSFIFQSGLYEARSNWFFSDFHLRLSKLIDLGNKMDINEVDALEYLAQDPETRVIAMHLESIGGDARRFLNLLQEITREKPVIVLKSGRTAAGAKAASSHTGAMMKSSDAIFDAALRQAGAIRAQGLDEFFDFAKMFEYLPCIRENRIAVACGSGGEGVLATDCCQLNGFTMAEPGPETLAKLRSIFPPWNIPVNPLDTGVCSQFNRGTDVHAFFLKTLADDPNVDCFVTQTNSAEFIKLAPEVIKQGKPVVVWVPDPKQREETIEQLESNRVPVYPSAERAIRALAAFYRYHSNQAARLND